MKNSLLEENLKYKKIKYFKSTSHFGFQLVSDSFKLLTSNNNLPEQN